MSPVATKWLGMGSWRFLLAALVVASHLWEPMVQGYAAYAVWAFFVLSGYLMTHVLQLKYGTSLRGTAAYAFNRILRIFPSYYVALGAGVVSLLVARRSGLQFITLNPEFTMPSGAGWLNPLTLLAVFPRNGLPVAVSNALAVEVTAYLFMPLLAAATPAALVALAFSAIATARIGFDPSSFAERYSDFIPCMLAFSWGSLTRHYDACLAAIRASRASVIVWMIHGGAWIYFPHWPWTYGLYVSLPLSSWVTISLFPRRSGTFDRWLGDLSFPLYLLHTIAGAWLFSSFGGQRSLALLAAAFGVSILLSILVVWFVEKPLQRVKLKQPSNGTATTPAWVGASNRARTRGHPDQRRPLDPGLVRQLAHDRKA